MYIIENELEISCSVQELFDYVTQPNLWHEWHPSSRSASKAEKPLQKGDTFDEMIRIKPLDPLPLILNKKTIYQVIESETNKLWIVEGQTDNGRLIIQYYFQPVTANRVLFKRKLSFEVNGWYKLLAKALVKNTKKVSLVALENLKSRFENKH